MAFIPYYRYFPPPLLLLLLSSITAIAFIASSLSPNYKVEYYI
jgi:hypothetical protein